MPVGLVGVGPGREQFVQFTDTSVPDDEEYDDDDDDWDEDTGIVGPGILVI